MKRELKIPPPPPIYVTLLSFHTVATANFNASISQKHLEPVPSQWGLGQQGGRTS